MDYIEDLFGKKFAHGLRSFRGIVPYNKKWQHAKNRLQYGAQLPWSLWAFTQINILTITLELLRILSFFLSLVETHKSDFM
jgi:hypothetical protein